MPTAMPRCPVVVLWGVSCAGQSPGEGFKKLRNSLESLPIKNSGAVIGEVGYLCAVYERIAFTTGPKLRAQLMVELPEDVTRE